MQKTFFFKSPGVEQWQSLPLGLFVDGLFCGGLCLCLCVRLHLCHMCADLIRGQRRVSDLLKLQ